jgi:dephospho-CoA kinase
VNPQNINERDLREFGAVILEQYDQVPLRRKLAQKIMHTRAPIVVDAIRELADVSEANLNDRQVVIWFVDASDAAIQERLRERAKNNPKKVAAGSPVDRTANLLRSRCDVILPNFGTLEDLRWKVDDEFFSLLQIVT